MPTLAEYAEYASEFEADAKWYRKHGTPELVYEAAAIGRVLRQLAEGAVLCEKTKPGPMDDVDAIYTPIEEQPC